MRGEHEKLVGAWSRAGLRLQRRVVGFALAAALIFDHGSREASGAGSLLLAYWALQLPVLGQQIGLCARQYPAQRSITLRFLELLGTPDDEKTEELSEQPGLQEARGVAVRFEEVSVRASGHTILGGVDLDIAPGSHVAIVGSSGAGKSSLVGLLLGWHEPAQGRILVDGEPLDAARRERLRRDTAWVDPGVHLWNRSLLENLRYGIEGTQSRPFAAALEGAGVVGVLDRLPDGLQSNLGEGGSLVSGGEGQRVRLARAALRPGTRLAILDEPFRGLARDQRVDLLAFARDLWRGSTLLCVTHDVGETLAFDRVIVVEGGRIVEDGEPAVLARSPSLYAASIEAERSLRSGLWSDALWRRIRLDRGRLGASVSRGSP